MKKSTTRFMGILLGCILSFPSLGASSLILPDEIPAGMEQAVKEVKVYPNPSDGKFNLSFEYDGKLKVTAKVFDITGKLVKDISEDLVTGETSVSANVDLDSPGSGIYFIRISWGKKLLTTKLIVR